MCFPNRIAQIIRMVRRRQTHQRQLRLQQPHRQHIQLIHRKRHLNHRLHYTRLYSIKVNHFRHVYKGRHQFPVKVA